MPGWNEVTELSDCLPVQRRVPQLVYIYNDICIYTYIYICIYTSGCNE